MIADSGKYISFILYVYMKRFYIESTSSSETSMKMTVLLPGCPSEFLLDPEATDLHLHYKAQVLSIKT